MKTTTEISTAAAALGRKGGSVKSEAKTTTARANGAKGGRPNLFKQAQEKLAGTNVELKKFRPKADGLYATANYIVWVSVPPHSGWDGRSISGHFDRIEDAVADAYEVAGLD
jgi:hypothetical protein